LSEIETIESFRHDLVSTGLLAADSSEIATTDAQVSNPRAIAWGQKHMTSRRKLRHTRAMARAGGDFGERFDITAAHHRS